MVTTGREKEQKLTRNTNKQSGQKRQNINNQRRGATKPRLEPIHTPDLPLPHPVVRIVKPERTDDTVRVPAREEGGGNGDEVGEDGHADCQDEADSVRDQDQDYPGGPALEGVLVDVAGAAE